MALDLLHLVQDFRIGRFYETVLLHLLQDFHINVTGCGAMGPFSHRSSTHYIRFSAYQTSGPAYLPVRYIYTYPWQPTLPASAGDSGISSSAACFPLVRPLAIDIISLMRLAWFTTLTPAS